MYSYRSIVGAWAACVLAGCAMQPVATREPANLSPHKKELRAYVASGQYLRDIAAVAEQAGGWIERRAAQRQPGERLAVVLDLDETLLFNYPHISRNDFGYVPAVWERWVDEASAQPIEPVRALYRTARRLEVDVIFITGRTERDRPATEQNLRAIGCAGHVALICKPKSASSGTAAFKTAARERMAKEGWTIVANVGDQRSDLSGGFAERTFKLSNPFYMTE